MSYPSYDPVHRRLAYQRRWLDFNIIRGSLRAPTTLPQTIVESTYMDLAIDMSPDDEHIIFISARTRNIAIWQADQNGANQILLAELPKEAISSPRWTPDGKSIICDGGRADSSALYTFSSENGVPLKMPNKGQLVQPFVSPDSKWIYYTNSSTSKREVYKIPFGDSPQTQFTREDGTDAISSANGTIVFFYRDSEIRRIAATGGPESTMTTGIKRGKWTVTGEKIYTIRARNEQSVIVEMSADSNNEKMVYQVPLQLVDDLSAVNSINISARTNEIFLQYQNRLDSDLMIVENFR